MAVIIGKLIFETPSSIKDKYYEALTWRDGDDAIRKSYFNDAGNLELMIPGDKYQENPSPSPGSVSNRFGGDWVQVTNVRFGFSIDVIEEMAELRFVFQELRRYQGATIQNNKSFRALRVWDYVGFDIADYGTGVTERHVKILGIEPQGGSGVMQKGSQQCVSGSVTNTPDNPRRFLGQSFKVTFEEFGHRETY